MAFVSSRNTPRRAVTRHPERLLTALVAGCLIVAGFALYAIESQRVPVFATPVPQSPEPITQHLPPLRVWFLDIDQGDATFIEMPDGSQVLIDGSIDGRVLTKLGQILPPWDRTIDVLVATHPDADHIGGLTDVLARYEVTTIIDNADTKDTRIQDAYVAAREAEPGATRLTVRQGDRFTFGDATLTALWPTEAAVADEESNYGSIVFLLTYGDTSVILPGDATIAAEEVYGGLAGDIDILKAGHHGSNGSSAASFLDIVTAEVGVFSCGLDNRYGHPHPAVLARMQERGMRILRTDLDGDILLTSRGGEPEITPTPLPF